VKTPKIALSACFFHADPERPLFKGKTLLYCEESMLHWIMCGGGLPYLIPTIKPPFTLDILLEDFDGLILQGGSDVCPRTYGEEPLRPEWSGDAIRDAYEIALVKHFVAAGKPVFGVCRGLQLINVALGGTLYQDIRLQHPGAHVHRDWNDYDQLFHDITFAPNSQLKRQFPQLDGGRVNSVHHQAIKDLGKDLIVEAYSANDKITEAISGTGTTYIYGVQWHPEFQDPLDQMLLPTTPLLRGFLDACCK
jgi:putative glutamine amidotransferase